MYKFVVCFKSHCSCSMWRALARRGHVSCRKLSYSHANYV